MAHITQCPICGSYTLEGIHPECRIAKLSDLLHQIQVFQMENPKVVLPEKLRDEILQGNFTTPEQFKGKLDQKSQKALEKTLHDAARQQHMQKAAEEFDRNHKDPDPITFA